jgi:2Fe-2S ferredoxin
MVNVTWIQPDGTEVSADVPVGQTLMDAAVENSVDGIIGECGGGMICATCRVQVCAEKFGLVGEPGPVESDLLEVLSAEPLPRARLSCQLQVTENFDGLVLTVPSENETL